MASYEPRSALACRHSLGIELRLGDLHHAMEDPEQADDMDRILARFGEVQEEYEHLGGLHCRPQIRADWRRMSRDVLWGTSAFQPA
ncbi:MAG: hypothetical protein WDO73_16290 [Ignavibacteriota bacterium]